MSGSKRQVVLAWALCSTLVMGTAGAILWREPSPAQRPVADNAMHDTRYDGCLDEHQGSIAVCDTLTRMTDTDREKAEAAMKQAAAPLPDEVVSIQPLSGGSTPDVSIDHPVLQPTAIERKNSESRERRLKRHAAARRKHN